MPHEALREPLAEAVAALEMAVGRFETKIGEPLVLSEERGRSIRYLEGSPEVVRVLKAVRVVSGLNACSALLAGGFIVEAEVVLRTVSEFLSDMVFLRRDGEQVSNEQQKYIEDFFAELPSAGQMWESRRQRGRVPRRKRLAGAAKHLAEVTGDPHTMTAVSKNLAELADRYVHGTLLGLMELYSDEGYRTCGVREEAATNKHLEQCVAFIHRSLNVFALLAHDLRLQDLMDELLESRRAFEKGSGYPGYR